MAILHDVKLKPGQRVITTDLSDPETKKRLSKCASEVYDLVTHQCKNPVEAIHVLRNVIDVIAKVHLGGTYDGMVELGPDEMEGKDA